jgi:hypothetical protein
MLVLVGTLQNLNRRMYKNEPPSLPISEYQCMINKADDIGEGSAAPSLYVAGFSTRNSTIGERMWEEVSYCL